MGYHLQERISACVSLGGLNQGTAEKWKSQKVLSRSPSPPSSSSCKVDSRVQIGPRTPDLQSKYIQKLDRPPAALEICQDPLLSLPPPSPVCSSLVSAIYIDGDCRKEGQSLTPWPCAFGIARAGVGTSYACRCSVPARYYCSTHGFGWNSTQRPPPLYKSSLQCCSSILAAR